MKKIEEFLVPTELFTRMMVEDLRQPTKLTCATHREWEDFDIPALEACSKNADKTAYTAGHLVEDLCWFFKYLPKTELNRAVRTMIWLLQEALKNYGYVTLSEFGSFYSYDRASKNRYSITTGEKFSARRMKLIRTVDFRPASVLMNILTPRDLIHNCLDLDTKSISDKNVVEMFNNFVYEKRHRSQGYLLAQTVFDLDFKYLGYSDAYIRAVIAKEVKVR